MKITMTFFLIGALTGILHSQTWHSIGTGTNGAVNAISPCGDGFLIGGHFTSAMGADAINFTRIHHSTGSFTVDTSFNLPLNISGTDSNATEVEGTYVNDLLCDLPDIYLAGDFYHPTQGIRVRFYSDALPVTLSYNGGAGTSLKVYQDTLYLGDEYGILRMTSLGFPGGGLDDAVYALEVYNNELYAAGKFNYNQNEYINGIARWDGSKWRHVGTGVNGTIYSLCVHNGKLIVGGNFSIAGGEIANNIAAWNGSQWELLGVGLSGGSMPTVRALVSFDSTLYAGGDFSESFGTTMNNIARWNGSQWYPVGDGTDGTVRALAVHDSMIIMGGDFQEANGEPHNYIVAYSHDRVNGVRDFYHSELVVTSRTGPNQYSIILDPFLLRENCSYHLYDIHGRLVKMDGIHSTHTGFSLNPLSPGLYILQVSDGQNAILHSEKLVHY